MTPPLTRRRIKNRNDGPYIDALMYAHAAGTLGRKTTCERNGQTAILPTDLAAPVSVPGQGRPGAHEETKR